MNVDQKFSSLIDAIIEKNTGLKIIQSSDKYICMFIITETSYYVAEKFYQNGKLSSWSAVEVYKEQKNTKVDYEIIKEKALKHMLENFFNKDEFLEELNLGKINCYCWQESYQ